MDRQAVKSGLIKSVAYDAEKLLLEVEFNGRNGKAGGVYRYADVPPHIYEEFQRAESKGRHFAMFIRPVFKCVKSTEEPSDASKSQAQSGDPQTDTAE